MTRGRLGRAVGDFLLHHRDFRPGSEAAAVIGCAETAGRPSSSKSSPPRGSKCDHDSDQQRIEASWVRFSSLPVFGTVRMPCGESQTRSQISGWLPRVPLVLQSPGGCQPDSDSDPPTVPSVCSDTEAVKPGTWSPSMVTIHCFRVGYAGFTRNLKLEALPRPGCSGWPQAREDSEWPGPAWGQLVTVTALEPHHVLEEKKKLGCGEWHLTLTDTGSPWRKLTKYHDRQKIVDHNRESRSQALQTQPEQPETLNLNRRLYIA